MSNQIDFEKYLEHRFQRAGALTPGQKLDVIRQLQDEARQQGRVPVGGTISTIPVEHPAVQAVLRGEEISLGATTVRGEKTDIVSRMGNLPLYQKLLIIAAMLLGFILLASQMAGGRSAAAETPSPTPTVYQEPTPLPLPTAIPPTPLPPPSPTAALMLGTGGPAANTRDPASIEIAGLQFFVSSGKVNSEDGKWTPQGPEWLAGTEVRRVFAIPYDNLKDANIQAGDPIYVRTRGGQVLTYTVRDVVTLQANQIETFFSLRPSLVVALPFTGGDVQSVERVLIFGEAEIDDELAVVEMDNSSNPPPNAFTFGGTNLRDNPGLDSNILIGMPSNTPLYLTSSPPVVLDEVTWMYVLSPYGYGWVAKQMIATP